MENDINWDAANMLKNEWLTCGAITGGMAGFGAGMIFTVGVCAGTACGMKLWATITKKSRKK